MMTNRRRTKVFLVLVGLVGVAPFPCRPEAVAQAPALPGSGEAAGAAANAVPAGPRDPFLPLVTEGGPPPEKRPLGGLRLTGVIWDSEETVPDIRALIETVDGLGYIVRVDDQRFGGHVVAIGQDRVQFAVVQEAEGQPRIQLIELKLDGAEPAVARTSRLP
jgi:hypothetical protein